MNDEVLIGERQHGNLGDVDLLRARERQQQIERALVAGDVDDKRVLSIERRSHDGLLPGRDRLRVRVGFCAHAGSRTPR